MTERSLARVVRIDEVKVHPNADALDLAMVGGWQVVIKKGDFKTGDLAIYFEIDSWIPTHIAPFLCKGKEPRVYKGIAGEKLRTIRLRKELSQGLLLPISILSVKTEDGEYQTLADEGDDVTDILGVTKWEADVPAQLAGMMKSYFPTNIVRKTDQERIQNLKRQHEKWITGEYATWEITEKLEGSSMTVYYDARDPSDIKTGVCSRNIDLKEDETNAFWAAEKKYGIIETLKKFHDITGESLAVQGELVGPGIQGNIYNLSETKFFVYSVWSINDQAYVSPNYARGLFKNLEYVPVVRTMAELPEDFMSIISLAEGESQLFKTEREGVVWKNNKTGESFKAISNKYLEIHGKD